MKTRHTPARLPALRRTAGPALARCRALCRHQRLRARRVPAAGVAVPRLRHSVVQSGQAVRSVHSRATRGRRTGRWCAEDSAEADMLIATGYLRLGQWDSTASIFQEEPRLQAEMMADLTNTTASAFLGLTMSCCQCHDHKYDPLSQADHYRLRAFFAGVTSA